MREYQVKTVKIGDSVVIALPRELLAIEHVTEDMVLKITVQKCQNGDLDNSKNNGLGCEDDPWRLLE
jgi:hypothetical protein